MPRMVEDPATTPVCPHCECALDQIKMQTISGGFLGKRYVYFCPACSKVLGIGQRKGYLSS